MLPCLRRACGPLRHPQPPELHMSLSLLPANLHLCCSASSTTADTAAQSATSKGSASSALDPSRSFATALAHPATPSPIAALGAPRPALARPAKTDGQSKGASVCAAQTRSAAPAPRLVAARCARPCWTKARATRPPFTWTPRGAADRCGWLWPEPSVYSSCLRVTTSIYIPRQQLAQCHGWDDATRAA